MPYHKKDDWSSKKHRNGKDDAGLLKPLDTKSNPKITQPYSTILLINPETNHIRIYFARYYELKLSDANNVPHIVFETEKAKTVTILDFNIDIVDLYEHAIYSEDDLDFLAQYLSANYINYTIEYVNKTIFN